MNARVELVRGRTVESTHEARIAVARGGKVVFSRGDVSAPVFLRSCAKPFQAHAAILAGAKLDRRQTAILCGSHDGEPEQVEVVRSILASIGMGPEALLCGAAWPSSRKAAAALKGPTALHHPCSGKHAGMLAACRANGWPAADYSSANHPLQKLIREVLSRFTKKLVRGVDGCGVPTYAAPLGDIAAAYEQLPAESRDAMLAHPGLVGRPCSKLIEAGGGKLVAKIGNEGVYGVSFAGAGLAIKVLDGSPRPLVPVIQAVCRKLGLFNGALPHEPPVNGRLVVRL